jgi:hypothetical protein
VQLARLRNAVADDDPFFDIASDGVNGQNMTEREEACGKRFVLAHQPEQYVLRCDDRRTVLESLVPGEENDPTGPLRVAFKHKITMTAFSWTSHYSEKAAGGAKLFQD